MNESWAKTFLIRLPQIRSQRLEEPSGLVAVFPLRRDEHVQGRAARRVSAVASRRLDRGRGASTVARNQESQREVKV